MTKSCPRLLVVTSCRECGNFYHDSITNVVRCSKSKRMLVNLTEIPDNCPLPEYAILQELIG